MQRQESIDLGAPAPNSYYAHMGVDILWTGDLLETEDMVVPPVRPDDETGSFEVLDGDGLRRGFERYDLTPNFVRASLIEAKGVPARIGRVTNASVTGMWVETEQPLPFRSEVDVDWCVMGSFSMRFPGRVVRATESGMAVVLEVDDSSWRFRSSFIDLARTPSDEPPTVIVQPRRAGAPGAREDARIVELATMWSALEKDLLDDDAHQAFINTALAAKRLEYALERYRELKLHNPTSEIATRYLKQIGTILTFYTLQREDEKEESPRWWKKSAGLIVLLAIALVVALSTVDRMAESRSSTVAQNPALHLTPPPGASR